MKSIAFFFTLVLLCVVFAAQAQTYELKDWNRAVITKVNNRNASVGRRFSSYNQVTFQGANRASGWIYAVNTSNPQEGLVTRGCASSNGCTTSQRVVGGTHHELNTMKMEDILALADQQALELQTTTATVKKADALNTTKANNVDLQKASATRVTPSNANLNRAKATQIRQ